MYAFTGPRKTHPQVRQYVFQVFHCKGVGCVFTSLKNAFDEFVSLVHRNICQKKKNTSRMSYKVSVSGAELSENNTWMVILFRTWLNTMVLSPLVAVACILVFNHIRNVMIIQVITSAHGESRGEWNTRLKVF